MAGLADTGIGGSTVNSRTTKARSIHGRRSVFRRIRLGELFGRVSAARRGQPMTSCEREARSLINLVSIKTRHYIPGRLEKGRCAVNDKLVVNGDRK
jgi:hypothetical protein